ncbi:MAG TPA: SPASM domain-containing protein [Pyrinomonadaceae bacterium]|nr:SPASM domain-containing protein [Pyrinomonadaceae bacterium]
MNSNSNSTQPEKRFCPKPFNFLSIHADGTGWVCCHDWLSTPIGNLNENTLSEVWNSETSQKIRASILDGSFSYCDKETCPALVKGTLPRLSEITDPDLKQIINGNLVALTRGPRVLSLTYDSSCNLKCPTCRSDFINFKGEEYRKAEMIQAKVFREGLQDAEELIITGYGDAFASRLYRKLLQTIDAKDFPNLVLTLMTNGLMFTPSIWDSLWKIHPAIKTLLISIDAATPETYAINRGGSFPKLMQNLEFAGQLRVEEKLRWWEITYVVQANNFREMIAFAEMGKRFHCDRVLFQKLIHWSGTYTDEQFKQVAIHDPAHPQHEEFLEVLRHPIFKEPLVDLSNLAGLV